MQKFHDFFNNFLSSSTKNDIKSDSTELTLEEPENLSKQEILQQLEENISSEVIEDNSNVKKRTILTRLYTLKQQIALFENDFPEEYKSFMERIERLRGNYQYSLEETKKIVTFEIDPEIDGYKIGEVVKLEKEVQYFLEKEVKFNIISKRLQQLIVKLNILYNVSIFHYQQDEKEKVVSQLAKAIDVLIGLVDEFKKCDYILCDTQLKERIISLVSYADYEIFKTGIRNTTKTPEELIKTLVMVVKFKEFDYTSTFGAFVKNEISDLVKRLPLTNERNFELLKIKSLMYSNNIEDVILSINFWNTIFSFETNLLSELKVNKTLINKEDIKVKLIDEMNIEINEKEVLISPIRIARIALTSLFVTTQDERILIVIKILENVSNDITFKEIYLLLILFDVMEIIQNIPNELIQHVEKYSRTYQYSQKDIIKKKQSVINCSKEMVFSYVEMFSLEDYEKEITTTLEKLNIDFKIEGENVLINSFYFNNFLYHIKQ